MRLSRRASLALAVAPAVILLGARVPSIAAHTVPDTHSVPTAERREVVRIQAHFDSVLRELASRPVSADASIARRRATLIRTLREYRDAGVFPHNYDFPDRAVPYFVDRETGTRCAVAHLLESTGRRDIVDRVARSNNNVWVAELSADTAFTHWLDANGITLAEAARIQVPYVQPSTPAQAARQTAFVFVAPVALGTATVTTMVNALGNRDGHRRSARILGFTAGTLAIGAGGLLMAKGIDDAPKVGAASAVIGGMSIALASRATMRHSAIVAQQRASERARSVQVSVSPAVVDGHSRAALSLALRY